MLSCLPQTQKHIKLIVPSDWHVGFFYDQCDTSGYV